MARVAGRRGRNRSTLMETTAGHSGLFLSVAETLRTRQHPLQLQGVSLFTQLFPFGQPDWSVTRSLSFRACEESFVAQAGWNKIPLCRNEEDEALTRH
jgi:hypothetical protein